jgi:NhaP-type Na+/H+ or K+/H+ antiporter
VGLGIAIPWLAIRIEQMRIFSAVGVYERLYPFAIALILFAVCQILNANLFIAAFTAGLTIATIRSELHESFEGFSEPVSELLKLGTILIFALHVGNLVLRAQSWRYYVLVAAAAFLVRLAAVPVALYRSGVDGRDTLLIGWFGPKGFASLVYGLMLLHVGSPVLDKAAIIVALTVAVSIFGYSSTDVLLGRWVERRIKAAQGVGAESGGSAFHT